MKWYFTNSITERFGKCVKAIANTKLVENLEMTIKNWNLQELRKTFQNCQNMRWLVLCYVNLQFGRNVQSLCKLSSGGVRWYYNFVPSCPRWLLKSCTAAGLWLKYSGKLDCLTRNDCSSTWYILVILGMLFYSTSVWKWILKLFQKYRYVLHFFHISSVQKSFT